MYRIVYDKQAIRDIKNLKSSHLDVKAKKLIEIVRKNPFTTPPKIKKASFHHSCEKMPF